MNEESLFAALLEKTSDQDRQALLDSACESNPSLRERLQGLLAGHACQGGILDQGGAGEYLKGKPSESKAHRITEGLGSSIGPYKLKEQIGEGGFGLVFVAEQQQPLRRFVALKLIKPGMDTRDVIARFEGERQALALMNHPNIASVFDAGRTESGRPYFVMELVRGIAITQYADQKQLTTHERIELFLPVCQAVQHAHQKGIIHRDLKPGNILVTQHDDLPVVKIIDFGIAKALHQRLTDHSVYTRFMQMMGTPSYMSPEQAEMSGLDVDTRSDIYSLGVLLYELLTGTTPFESDRLNSVGFDEWRRIVREEEPPRPSTRISTLGMAATTVAVNRRCDPRQLSDSLRGELDWIILKALEKNRSRRYATAADLARDLERYQRHEPVEASPASSIYRLRKFVRRHRGPVLAAMTVLVVLIGGVIGTSLGMYRAWEAQEAEARRADGEARERRRAEKAETRAEFQAAEAKKAADTALGLVQFLRKDLLQQAGAQSQMLGRLIPNPNLTVREALDRAADRLGDQFKEQPDVEAAIRLTIGVAYHHLGLFDSAIVQLRRALELRSGTMEQKSREWLQMQHHLAVAYRDAGKTAEAIKLFLQVRESQLEVLGAEHSDTLTTFGELTVAYRNAGRRTEAMEQLEQLRVIRSRVFGPEDPATLITLHNIATMHLEAGNLQEAITQLEKVRDAKIRILGPEHLDTLPTLGNLAVAYWKNKQLDKSLPIFEKLVPVYQKLLGESHPETYRLTANLGVNYRDARRLEEAIPLLKKAYLASRQHPSLSWVAGELQIAYVRAGKNKEAIALIREELALANETMAKDGSEYAACLARNGLALLELGAHADAEPLLRQCVAIRKTKEPNAWRTFNAVSLLGEALRGQKKYAEAEPLLREGYAGMERWEAAIDPASKIRLADAADRLIQLYLQMNKPDQVKKWQAERAKYPTVAPNVTEKK